MAAAVRRAPLLHTSRHTSCTCTRAPLAPLDSAREQAPLRGARPPGAACVSRSFASRMEETCVLVSRMHIAYNLRAHCAGPSADSVDGSDACPQAATTAARLHSRAAGRPSHLLPGLQGALGGGDAEGVLQNGGHPAQLPAVVLVRRLHLRPCAPARAHHLAGCEKTARWPTAWHCVARVGILIQLLDKDRLIVSANGAGPCRASHETGCHCGARASRWPADHIL